MEQFQDTECWVGSHFFLPIFFLHFLALCNRYLISFCFSKVLFTNYLSFFFFTNYLCMCARANCMHMLTHMFIYIEISSTQYPELLQKEHTHTHTLTSTKVKKETTGNTQKLPQCLLPTTNPIFSGGTHSTIIPTQINSACSTVI